MDYQIPLQVVTTYIARNLKGVSLNGNYSNGGVYTGSNTKVLGKDGKIEHTPAGAISAPNGNVEKLFSVLDVTVSAVLVKTDEGLICKILWRSQN